MATRKINIKSPPKKSRYSSNQTDPYSAFCRAEIVYENSDDLLGTIKFLDEELDTFQKIEKFKNDSPAKKEPSPEAYLALEDKFKATKNRAKLKFSDYELNILEKALEFRTDHIILDMEVAELRTTLAWANTAFKDKDFSYQENLSEAGRRLGFTKGAKKLTPPFHIPPKGKKRRYSPQEVTSYYNNLIKSNIDRKDALIKCTKRFEFASNNACSKYLRDNGLKDIPQIRKSTARLK